MAFAVKNIFDVTNWYLKKAMIDQINLQPAKLYRILFLSSIYYSVVFSGKKLMPATFVIDEDHGPIEPNLYAIMPNESEYNIQYSNRIDEQTESFLESIWLKFSRMPINRLSEICELQNYVWNETLEEQGNGAELNLEECIQLFSDAKRKRPKSKYEQIQSFRDGKAEIPPVEDVITPRNAKTVDGKIVSLQPWMPGRK